MKSIIPKEALDKHLCILGKTGSGKSNTAKIIAEELLDAGERVCVIDPTGTWWGMRLSQNGKKASAYSPIIFGGFHGDLPISAEHGGVIAEALGTSRSSAIIDTRSLTVSARTKFFTGFAEGLLRENRGNLHLIIDEAHLFAPQGRVNSPQSGTMLQAANNLVSLGRGIGLRIILISQRPAKLHKDSLTQVETLVAMRLIAPQDRNAIKEWIGEYADPVKGKEIIASLPSLPTGSAWVWSPEIDMLERVKFPLARTFDSGRPRSEGDAKLPSVDTKELATKLKSIKEEVVTNDPVFLKRRIAELERSSSKVSSISAQEIADAERAGFKKGKEDGYLAGWDSAIDTVTRTLRGIKPEGEGPFKEAQKNTFKIELETPEESLRKHRHIVRAATGTLGMSNSPLLLAAEKFHPVKLTWVTLAATCGRKARGGHFSKTKKALLEGGYVCDEKGVVEVLNPPATRSGVVPADDLEKNLPQPARKMFAAIRIQPGMTQEELSENLGMVPRGGHWTTGLQILRSNKLITESDGLVISPELESMEG